MAGPAGRRTYATDPSKRRSPTKEKAKPGRRLFGRAPASATPKPSTSYPTLTPRNRFGRALSSALAPKQGGEKLSKAGVMADLKKVGHVLTAPSRFMEKHRTSVALAAFPGGLAKTAVSKAAGKMGVKALIKKAGSRAYTSPRNWPNIIMTKAGGPVGGARGRSIIEWNVPPRAGIGMEKWAGAMGPRPPGHVNLRPIIRKGKPNVPGTGAAKTQEGRYISWRTQQANELIKESLRLKPHSSGRWSPPNMPVGPPTVAKLKYPGGRKLDPLKKRPRL